MRLRITELRKIIRTVLVESYEADEDVYDDTVLPGDEADDELLAEPDLTDQKERDQSVGGHGTVYGPGRTPGTHPGEQSQCRRNRDPVLGAGSCRNRAGLGDPRRRV